ncbi:hypothetical protein GT347_25315 [Xylophilus rhododendri]|uniref:(2Fe-2S) ferredoxin domain-containing protein n=1 Tax=Xylophilus rhododendri TaxID=2697032 RepID=A0A857JCS8_9BURK|nr:(2Fe-2S) ferredoxin domain-containing protein [Xylophilus rhododendri]QHJ01014.1 hypothetical protein GT347_25315 [Xylophilus rhododendri]
MKNESPRELPFRLDAMVLVCKACGKRSSGPKKFKPKHLAQEFKSEGREARMKTRVVLTSCMGLCPKNAAAVAAIGPDGHPAQFAIESLDQVPQALAAAAPGRS